MEVNGTNDLGTILIPLSTLINVSRYYIYSFLVLLLQKG